MGLIPRLLIDQDRDFGLSFLITDATGAYDAVNNPGGFGAPNNLLSDVAFTRLLLSDSYSRRYAGMDITTIPFKEYTLDPTVQYVNYDTKVLASAQGTMTAIAAQNIPAYNPLLPLGIKETGNTYIPLNAMPTNTNPVLGTSYLLPNTLYGATDPTTPFQDAVYNFTYSFYGTALAPSGSTIVANTKYFVASTNPLDRIDVLFTSGPTQTYRVGEELYLDTATFALFSQTTCYGAARLYPLLATNTMQGGFTFNSKKAKSQVLLGTLNGGILPNTQASDDCNAIVAQYELLKDCVSYGDVDEALFLDLVERIGNRRDNFNQQFLNAY